MSFRVLSITCYFSATDAQNSTDTTPTTTPSTVNSPTEGLTVQNYNGDNVTVSNVTTDHHRYYNR